MILEIIYFAGGYDRNNPFEKFAQNCEINYLGTEKGDFIDPLYR